MDSFLKSIGMKEHDVDIKIFDAGNGNTEAGCGGVVFVDELTNKVVSDNIIENHFGDEEENNQEEEEINQDEDEEEDEEEDGNNMLNSEDEDESIEDKIYIISIDGKPFYYDNDLKSAKQNILAIGNEFLISLNQKYEISTSSSHYKLLCDFKLRKIDVVSTYSFFGLFSYNHTLFNLNLDYVIKNQ